MDPETAGAVAIVTIVLFLPAVMYAAIMARWCCDKRLHDQLGMDHALWLDPNSAKGEGSKAEGERAANELKPILLSFRNVSFVVQDRGNPKDPSAKKTILTDVSGFFRPKTLSAIMGQSGCGKTTLMTILANQAWSGEVTGEIRMNGAPPTRAYRSLMAFVVQSDHLLSTLTVRETLWFAAELRLSKKFSLEQKFDALHETLRDLDLVRVADVRTNRLSGGQKRRLTVALEVIAKPTVLFLDEPTSGLDAGGALTLVEVLRKLADQGRTIVATIHQPRADAFQMFDTLLLMHYGRVMYFGSVPDILPYFSAQCPDKLPPPVVVLESVDEGEEVIVTERAPSLGASRPSINSMRVNGSKLLFPVGSSYLVDEDAAVEAMNPADLVLDLTHDDPEESARLLVAYESSVERTSLMAKLGRVHDLHMSMDEEIPLASLDSTGSLEQAEKQLEEETPDCRPSCATRPVESGRYVSTLLKQTYTLTRRAFVNDIRTPASISQFILGIIMMAFLGMLYCYVPTAQIAQSAYDDVVDPALDQWGACTQNTTSLAQILNTTTAGAESTLLDCGMQLATGIQLSQARSALLYQLLASLFFSEMPMVAAIYEDRIMFAREHASRSYSSGAWIFSWLIRLAFSALVKGLIYPPFVYFSARLPIDAAPYFLLCIFFVGMSLAGGTVALLVTGLTKSFETASVAFVVVNIVAQNLSLFFIEEDYIPQYFRWIVYINFFSYAYTGTQLSQTLTDQLRELDPATYSENQKYAFYSAIIMYILVAILALLSYLSTWFINHTPDDDGESGARGCKDPCKATNACCKGCRPRRPAVSSVEAAVRNKQRPVLRHDDTWIGPAAAMAAAGQADPYLASQM